MGRITTEEQIKEDFLPEKPEKQSLIKHYYHTDQIGTPLALVNEMGEIDWEIIIDPYGNRVREENPKKLYQPIRMQGQQYDIESGLHYNRHRYYDPKQGRYISQDPIGLQGGINNYVYPLNPNQALDPLGLKSITRSTQTRIANRYSLGVQNYSWAMRQIKAVNAYIYNQETLRQLKDDIITDIDGHIKGYNQYIEWLEKSILDPSDIDFEDGLSIDDLIHQNNRYSCEVNERKIRR